MLKKEDIPNHLANGNCYETAFNLLGTYKHMTLVHAIVTGREDLEGVRFIHAWIESDEFAFDLSNKNTICMPKYEYRALGRVQHLVEYTYDEAIENSYKYNHYGYWDKKLGSMEDIQ